MSFEGKWLHTYAGRDRCRVLDVGLFIGFFPHNEQLLVGQELRYRLSIEASWDWLPTIQRIPRHWPTDLASTSGPLHYEITAPWYRRWPRWRVVGWYWPIHFRCKCAP